MIVRNRKNNQSYETTKADYERLIVSQGLSHMYEIVGDDTPMEIKVMRQKMEAKKKEEELTPISTEVRAEEPIVIKEKKNKKIND